MPTFCFNVPGRTSQEVATHLAERTTSPSGGATTTRSRRSARLGLDEWTGAVRAGIVHYNTAEEVDRLLAGIAELA